jgi:hypothetical protein
MSAIPVSDLGLNSSEARYLQQQIAASQQGSNSSRAASHASSQGRLLLDPSSLQALSAHFDRLMYSIQQRWHYVSCSYQRHTRPRMVCVVKIDNANICCPTTSSRNRPRRQPKCSTTAPVTRSRWPTPKSPVSEPFCAKSTSYRSNSIKCVALARL